MRFTCEHCNTRYAIPDQRIAGRVLKIRCKRCRSVVEVMGPPPAGAPGAFEAMAQVASVNTRVERVDVSAVRPELEHRLNGVHLPSQISDVKQAIPRHAPRREPAEQEWWIGLRGKPTGPLGRDELLVYAQRGALTLRTYAWRTGQGSWQRIDKAPGLAFLRDAIQRRQRAAEQPRRMTGMESGVFAASGLFDASALAAVLQQQVRPVETDKAREPSGLTRSLANEVTPVEKPRMLNRAVVPEDEPNFDTTQTIRLGDSGWFVIDERLQQSLWQRDLPPDLPGTTAMITGVHLLPQRRRFKAVAAVAVIGALFLASAVLVAWLTRDSLVLALAPPVDAQGHVAASYSPGRALVDKVRRALDPRRGQGVRLPTFAPASIGEATLPLRPVAPRVPRVVAAPGATVDLSSAVQTSHVVDPVLDRKTGATGQAVSPGADWSALQAPAPSLDLGAPVMADSPEVMLPGELTAEHVARVVQTRLPQLESAYTAALKRNPSLAGVVDTSIVIGRDGRVKQVSVQAPGEEGGYLASLLTQRMRRWTFPRPSSELEVVLPLRFKSVY